ncbi:MAG: methionyl-tRNA formyltransferase [Lentisphaerae bacterium]|nr:methionyl-tRNA formyltransferase [Lentisphaerota bacterium]
MRIVFMGSAETSAVMLDALVYMRAAEVVGVVTQPDRPCGRRQHFMPCPCKAKAHVNALTVISPEKVNRPEAIEQLRAWAPDLIVVVAYGQFLGKTILALPPLGCINIHLSLLPRYRGAAPVQRAIAAGETVTGVTAMMMDEGMDSGDLLMQSAEPILRDDTAQSLLERLALLGAVALLRVVRLAETGQLTRTPQDASLATFAPKLSKQDGAMDWTRTATELALRVRAFNPWPGCFTWLPLTLKGGTLMRLKLLRSEALPDWVAPAGLAPGTVCDVSGEGPVVLTGHGGLRLLEAQPEGARRMSGKALLCGHPLRVGDRLAAPLYPAAESIPEGPK